MSDKKAAPAVHDPQSDDFSSIELPGDLHEALEPLARQVHDAWAQAKIEIGYSFGPETDDEARTHKDLVPYEDLSDDVKELDRQTARRVIQALLGLGYEIVRRD